MPKSLSTSPSIEGVVQAYGLGTNDLLKLFVEQVSDRSLPLNRLLCLKKVLAIIHNDQKFVQGPPL